MLPIALRTLLASLAAVTLMAAPAVAADKRVALVIGNTSYTHRPASPTAVNDAKLLGKTLRELGFTVHEHHDLNRAAMIEALDQFSTRVHGADWAAFYYAGDGVQIGGTSYVVPVDAQLASEVGLAQIIPVDHLFERSANTLKLRLVVLDMPRINPFGRAAPAAGKGLPAGEKRPPPGDEVIAYATGPGRGVSIGNGPTGVFAMALARELARPGAEIKGVFQAVRNDGSPPA